ncbi:peptidase inhibitor family I36 protein [Streptomyces niveus]|uniref:peptidase inhibitor family I36 protein n=1 Tax=Streptomyces niveus TaxID=193462 RepID=UPI00386560D7
MTRLKKSLVAVLPLVAALASIVPMSTSASAAPGTSCNPSGYGCMTFFYNSNRAGSQTYFNANVSDLAPYTFLTSGSGQGQGIKNNAASADNDASTIMTIYYNSGYAGPCDTLEDFSIANQLRNTYNQNASFRWNYTRSDCYVF